MSSDILMSRGASNILWFWEINQNLVKNMLADDPKLIYLKMQNLVSVWKKQNKSWNHI